jgi:hypothetical protein
MRVQVALTIADTIVSFIDFLLLSANSLPCLFLFVLQACNHVVDVMVVTPFFLLMWIDMRCIYFHAVFVKLLLIDLIGAFDEIFLYLFIFEIHLLNILLNFLYSPSQSVIHLLVPSPTLHIQYHISLRCILHLNLVLKLLSLGTESIQLRIELISDRDHLLCLGNLWMYVVYLRLHAFNWRHYLLSVICCVLLFLVA